VRADGQEPDRGAPRRASGPTTAKPVSIKGAQRRFGGFARFAPGRIPRKRFFLAAFGRGRRLQPPGGRILSFLRLQKAVEDLKSSRETRNAAK
jgi:hypothetical protein